MKRLVNKFSEEWKKFWIFRGVCLISYTTSDKFRKYPYIADICYNLYWFDSSEPKGKEIIYQVKWKNESAM